MFTVLTGNGLQPNFRCNHGHAHQRVHHSAGRNRARFIRFRDRSKDREFRFQPGYANRQGRHYSQMDK